MSLNVQLTITARGKKAAEALGDILVHRPYWHPQESNQDGVVVTEVWGMIPAEWRPVLEDIAAARGVILEVHLKLTDPDDFENDWDEESLFRIGPSSLILQRYEALIKAIDAMASADMSIRGHRNGLKQAMAFLTDHEREWIPDIMKKKAR